MTAEMRKPTLPGATCGTRGVPINTLLLIVCLLCFYYLFGSQTKCFIVNSGNLVSVGLDECHPRSQFTRQLKIYCLSNEIDSLNSLSLMCLMAVFLCGSGPCFSFSIITCLNTKEELFEGCFD